MCSPMLNDATFRAVVEEAPDAILLIDREGQIAHINLQAETLFGYSRAELIGQRVEVLVPEDMRSMHLIHREVYQEQPEKRPMGTGLQLYGRRRDGTVFPVEISLSPVGDGGSGHTVAVVRDVTHQRRAEEALRRSEERHRLLNERAESIIFRYRLLPSPGFEYVSASIRGHLGHEPEELYVDPEILRRATHPDDVGLLDQALSPEAPRNVTLRFLRRDGSARWFEISVTQVHNADGTVVALEGIARDVTERRVADEQRVQLQSEIELQSERNRIAGDLHDDTIQSIYALGLGLHAARDDDRMTREELADQAIAGLNQVIASLRNYMHRLSGDAADEDDQRKSLSSRVASLVVGDGGTRWDVAVQQVPDLDSALTRQVFLLAKELVSNVQRHSQATEASLSLSKNDEEELVLEVTDNGVGFDRDAVGPGSFGLRSLELRAQTLDASFEIESSPGSGTRARVSVPLSLAPEGAPAD